MSAKILDGKIISGEILDEVAGDVVRLKSEGWTPRLVSIKVGHNPSVDLYVRNQKNKAEKTGIEFIERHFPENTSLEIIRTSIFAYNIDPRITGVILQRPVPETLSIKALQKFSPSIRKMLRGCTQHQLVISFITN